MRITFIATCYNEEKNILSFLKSLANQSRLPDEIVLVDGESHDDTLSLMSKFDFPIPQTKVKILTKNGNRSVGRNEAINHSTHDIIVCSDIGCVLDKNFIQEITQPFSDTFVDVVAGYYDAKATTIFQKCLVPYALVMPDKLDPKNFLPATRSIAFKKSVWESVGGFDVRYSHNEDYVFARRLREKGRNIVLAQKAVVTWIPRDSIRGAYHMMWRFALGDAEAGILRPKVALLLIRYFIAISLVIFGLFIHSLTVILLSAILFFCYVGWAIQKNYRYVRDIRAFFCLPLLQFVADFAVLDGTTRGLLKRVRKG